MFILLNGSFGIGKTTIAELLVQNLPNAAIYDPERPGYVLRRLPAWMLGLARQPQDYQDLALWRKLIALGAKRRHKKASAVIVPMAFTNLRYLDDFARALDAHGRVHRLCLVAPLEVVRSRLLERARKEARDVSEFEWRRSEECVRVHGSPSFGTPIDASKTPAEVVTSIRSRLLE